MSYIRHESVIDAEPDEVWAALRDWGQLHSRLVPGFVVDTQVDGRDRIVTFGSGAILRERIIDVDDDARRLAWSIVNGPYTHHNASAQVFTEPDGCARFVWIADLLPDEVTESTSAAMQLGIDTIKHTLEERGHRSGIAEPGR